MRSLLIVNVHELIEATLLLQEVEGGRLGSLLLQGEVHTLVASVLFGVTWLDALDADAQAQPPDRKPAQAEHNPLRQHH